MIRLTALILLFAISAARAEDDHLLQQPGLLLDNNSITVNDGKWGTIETNDRALNRYREWHWYELNDSQYSKLVATLKGVKSTKHVNVECADADCRGLAEDMVDALNDAGWSAKLISHYFLYRDVPIGNGLSCDGAFLCAAITSATGIKTRTYEGPPETFTLVFGPKK